MGKYFQKLSDKKAMLFPISMCIMLFLYACINALTLSCRESEFLLPFYFVGTFLICAFGALAWMLHKNKINNSTALIISASVLGLCYLFLFPPVTVPDEQAHYLSAYRISNYMLFDFSSTKTEGMFMRECDLKFFETLLPNVDGEYIKSIYGDANFIAGSTKNVWYECSFVGNAPFSYLLSAFGITMARILHLGPLVTIVLGRVMNLVGFTALTVYAVKKMPAGRNILLMIAGLPIVLHLSASFSYDSITLGFTFVFISQVLYIKEKDSYATIKDFIILAAFAMLLAPSKLVYFPIVLLVFVIPADKFKLSKRNSVILKMLIVALALALLVALQLSSVKTISQSQTSGWTDEPPYNIKWIFTNLIESCKIFINTIITFAHFYIKNLFGGLLGWLNVDVPTYLWIPQMLLVLSGCIKYKNEKQIFQTGQKTWVWLCLIASTALVMLSMFVAWTPMGSKIIYGVQGRYFLPLLLPLLLVLRCKRVALGEASEKYILTTYMAFGFATVINLFVTVTA